MKQVRCNNCGADDLTEKNGFLVCSYCRSKFAIERDNKHIYNAIKNSSGQKSNGTNIALNEDVQRLLDKCKREPKNAKRYANLILDIDPTNREALKYL